MLGYAVSLDTDVVDGRKKIAFLDPGARTSQVRAALSLAPVELRLQASLFADVLARLESQRERQGPRALVFELSPGKSPRVVVQPWGDVYEIGSEPYAGSESRTIKVWGRRRLRVLRDLLPLTNELTVRLVDSGMPSFWSIQLDGINLTLGLSGWTAQDWAGRARFPHSHQQSQMIKRLSKKLLRYFNEGIRFLSEIWRRPLTEPGEARGLLQGLCLSGSAMFDPERQLYRWRSLFPNLSSMLSKRLAWKNGKECSFFEMILCGESDTIIQGTGLKATVDGCSPMLRRDIDGRINYAQCDCTHFKYHKLRQGPCRHIVALSLKGCLSMLNTDGGLDPRWRKRIEEVGKNAFEIEEMVRLGFLAADDFEKQLNDKGLSLGNTRVPSPSWQKLRLL